jgi:hypothetical protein
MEVGSEPEQIDPAADGGSLLERSDDPAEDGQVGHHPSVTGGLSASPLCRRMPRRASTGAQVAVGARIISILQRQHIILSVHNFETLMQAKQQID